MGWVGPDCIGANPAHFPLSAFGEVGRNQLDPVLDYAAESGVDFKTPSAALRRVMLDAWRSISILGVGVGLTEFMISVT